MVFSYFFSSFFTIHPGLTRYIYASDAHVRALERPDETPELRMGEYSTFQDGIQPHPEAQYYCR